MDRIETWFDGRWNIEVHVCEELVHSSYIYEPAGFEKVLDLVLEHYKTKAGEYLPVTERKIECKDQKQ